MAGSQTKDHIDQGIDFIKAFQILLAEALTPKVVELKRARNLTAPIHRLLLEIFVGILLQTLDEREKWSAAQLHRLAKVSTTWCTTIKSTPLFWQHLSTNDEEEIRQRLVKINSTGPLKIVFTPSRVSSRVTLTHVEALMELGKHHSNRWTSVFIDLDSHQWFPEAFPEFMALPTPNLADIHLCGSRPPEGTAPPQIILSEGRPLRNVYLHTILIPWDHARLTKLRAITIAQLEGSLPSIPHLHAMLSGSPQLRFLKLSRLIDQDYTESPPPSTPTSHRISLPSLTELILKNIPCTMTDFVLSVIDTGTTPGRMRLDVDDVLAAPPIILPHQVLPGILSRSKRIIIIYEDEPGNLSISTDPERRPYPEQDPLIRGKFGCSIALTRQVAKEYGPTAVEWLTSRPMPPTKLILKIGYLGKIDRNFPNKLLDELPSLTSLDLSKCDIAGPIMRRLAIPSKANGSWVCPLLKELDSGDSAG